MTIKRTTIQKKKDNPVDPRGRQKKMRQSCCTYIWRMSAVSCEEGSIFNSTRTGPLKRSLVSNLGPRSGQRRWGNLTKRFFVCVLLAAQLLFCFFQTRLCEHHVENSDEEFQPIVLWYASSGTIVQLRIDECPVETSDKEISFNFFFYASSSTPVQTSLRERQVRMKEASHCATKQRFHENQSSWNYLRLRDSRPIVRANQPVARQSLSRIYVLNVIKG